MVNTTLRESQHSLDAPRETTNVCCQYCHCRYEMKSENTWSDL